MSLLSVKKKKEEYHLAGGLALFFIALLFAVGWIVVFIPQDYDVDRLHYIESNYVKPLHPEITNWSPSPDGTYWVAHKEGKTIEVNCSYDLLFHEVHCK